MTETEIRIKGMEALTRELGPVEAQRFIALMLREPFDYTEWRKAHLFPGMSIDEIHRAATKDSHEKLGD